MPTTIANKHVREALGRIQRVLVDAAGEDQRLSKAELAHALSRMAPTERVAVDAFARELEAARKPRGQITVRDIDSAILGAQTRLAPAEVPALAVEDIKAADAFGAGLIKLATRLAGEAGAVLPPFDAALVAGKRGPELLQALRDLCAPHVSFSYGSARDVMFAHVDGKDGSVTDVYGGRQVPLSGRHELADVHQINTEHTHPQSRGVGGTPAKTDLHHLFPTDANANGKRSSLPFGTVVQEIWRSSPGALANDDVAKLGKDAAGELVFEPPLAHKGDAARAMFYVAAIYGLPMSDAEEKTLRRWHGEDPVDAKERARNDAISAQQENRNPFVDVPGLVDRLDDI